MKYFAITRDTAAWVNSKPGVRVSLSKLLVSPLVLQGLLKGDFIEGPIRVSLSADASIVVVWNSDYLSGAGDESWGFGRITGDCSLSSDIQICSEVFERCLTVMDIRLKGLRLDDKFIHRSWETYKAHTCIAGRSNAREVSIGFKEAEIVTGTIKAHSLICVGPDFDFDKLARLAAEEAANLPNMNRRANEAVYSGKSRPALDVALFEDLRFRVKEGVGREEVEQTSPTLVMPTPTRERYDMVGWGYDEWIQNKDILSAAQRNVLFSDKAKKHPIRILGPAGSGKSLLMQLLAMKLVKESGDNFRILYVSHNSAMAEATRIRFQVLGASEFLEDKGGSIVVSTLAEQERNLLEVGDAFIIDKDAQETKRYQYENVREALRKAFDEKPALVNESTLFSQARDDRGLFDIVSILVMSEISLAIKGQALMENRRGYIYSERALSRFHKILTIEEREIVFDAFSNYHFAVFETYEVLDADDLALSLLGKLRTPIWELRRRSQGYDYVFVDETQLFNENEKQVLPLLTKNNKNFVPIVLALDGAQEFYGLSSAGIATLGIENVSDERLDINHRSRPEIRDLAFYVIQNSIDLFGNDFPEFKLQTAQSESSAIGFKPRMEKMGATTSSFSKFIKKTVGKLKKDQCKRIAIIVYNDIYWHDAEEAVKDGSFNYSLLLRRGEKLGGNEPIVVVTKPAYVGGQEFDGVVLLGLEQGVFPPSVPQNPVLAQALEQQALREIYLGISRAKERVVVVLNKTASPCRIMRDASNNDYLAFDPDENLNLA